MVTSQCRKLPKWKAPGKDGVQGFWLKKLRGPHGRIAEQLNNNLGREEELPEWLTFGKTILCLKDHSKGNAVDNFRPISCLPLMWKLMTCIIAEVMYKHLVRIPPEEQKGCRKRSRGTKDQLLIDKAILKDCKRRHTNLAMAWIFYRKAYDMVPHSGIGECLEMFGIAVNVRAGYEWRGREFKINNLLFMDDLKRFGKSYEPIDSLVQTVHSLSTDIGMKFGIKKCGVLVLKRGKIVKMEGVVLPNGQAMKDTEDGGYRL